MTGGMSGYANDTADEPFFEDQTFVTVQEPTQGILQNDNPGSSQCISELSDNEHKFNSFWELYPKKVGKENARIAFKRLAPDDELIGRMLYAIEEQKKSAQWSEQRYIPNPATWIIGRRWEDETVVNNSDDNRNYIDLESFFEN